MPQSGQERLRELLELYIRDGNAAAMEELTERTRPRLLKAARRIGAPQDAEDSVQAAYHSLLRRGDRPLDAPVLAWLLTAVVRIAYRRKALGQREAQLADRLAVPANGNGPSSALQETERGEIVRAEVARLPAKYRDVLVLRYLEDLSVEETARLLHIPPETARTRLRRARSLLRGRLMQWMAYAVLFLPWLAADTARAGTHSLLTLGVIMKTKLAVVVALLALLSVALLSSDLFRSGQTEHAPRSPDPSADPSTRSAAAPEVSAEDAGPAARAKTANAPLPAPVDLEAVDRHRDLHGIVVHRDGTPLAGAELQVLAYPWRRASTLNMDTYDSAVEGPATLSARDGTFALRLQRGDLRHLRVSAPDMASRQVPLVQAGERMKIVMDAGVQVHVQAIESDGSPAKDAKLRLFHAGSSGSHNLELSGVTGDDGRFSFQVAPGPARGWVEAERADMGAPVGSSSIFRKRES